MIYMRIVYHIWYTRISLISLLIAFDGFISTMPVLQRRK
jgi:hypothetical protein